MNETIPIDQYPNLHIEVTKVTGYKSTMHSGEGKKPKALAKVSNAIQHIGKVMSDSMDTLQDLTQAPDEIEIQVGINFEVGGNAYIVSGKSGATFLITAKWNK